MKRTRGAQQLWPGGAREREGDGVELHKCSQSVRYCTVLLRVGGNLGHSINAPHPNKINLDKIIFFGLIRVFFFYPRVKECYSRLRLMFDHVIILAKSVFLACFGHGTVLIACLWTCTLIIPSYFKNNFEFKVNTIVFGIYRQYHGISNYHVMVHSTFV